MSIYKTDEGTIVTVDPVEFNKKQIVDGEGLATIELQVLKNGNGYFIGRLYKVKVLRLTHWYFGDRISDISWSTKEAAEKALISGDYPIYAPVPPENPTIDDVYAYYRWSFNVYKIDRNGKKRKNHFISVIASSYEDAKFSTTREVESKKGKLVKINSVKIDSRGWAKYRIQGNITVPDEIFKSLPLPVIPDIL